MCDLFNNLDKEKKSQIIDDRISFWKARHYCFSPSQAERCPMVKSPFYLFCKKLQTDQNQYWLHLQRQISKVTYLICLFDENHLMYGSILILIHNTGLPIRFQCLCGKSTTSGFLPGRTSGNCLVWYLYIPTPFKSLLDVKADNLHLLQTDIFIRIAESFYWALACFYEEVSLAEGCLFASSQRWKVGPLAVRRLSGAGGLPELPCCAPHRHSVTFGQAVCLNCGQLLFLCQSCGWW